MEFQPLSAVNWPLLETLFGEKGACGGCWCMAWRYDAKTFNEGKGEPNKLALKALAAAIPSPGILAIESEMAAGWIAIAPREQYHRLEKSKVLQPVDEQKVWSISCFYIHNNWRRKGLSTQLIHAATDYAKQHGAIIIEGYPTDTSTGNGKFVPVFNWTGVLESFAAAGFTEVVRRSTSRPIMRKTV